MCKGHFYTAALMRIALSTGSAGRDLSQHTRNDPTGARNPFSRRCAFLRLSRHLHMVPIDADPSRVRLATRRDSEDILELCRLNHEENGRGRFSEDKVWNVIVRALDVSRNDPGLIGVVGETRVEGSLAIVVNEPWDSDDGHLACLWNFVLPEFRAKTTHSRDLLAWAKRLSEPAPVGLGLPLWMGMIASPKTEAKMRLYRRQLGDPIGYTFMCGSEGTA